MNKLLAIERRQKIVDIIQKNNKVLVSELAPIFSVTEETIRRDLENLEGQGILKRSYGGAILNKGTNSDLDMDNREIENKDLKIKLANAVAKEIEDGETIMLDSSSTALYVAKALKRERKKVIIVTNSLKIVDEIKDENNINVILAGGTFRKSSKSFVGKWAERIISNYYVNKSIIGCKALNIDRGITDSNEEEAEVKRIMAKCAQKVYLLADSQKFDKTSFVKIIDYSEINYIYTDKDLDDEWKNVLSENNVVLEISK